MKAIQNKVHTLLEFILLCTQISHTILTALRNCLSSTPSPTFAALNPDISLPSLLPSILHSCTALHNTDLLEEFISFLCILLAPDFTHTHPFSPSTSDRCTLLLDFHTTHLAPTLMTTFLNPIYPHSTNRLLLTLYSAFFLTPHSPLALQPLKILTHPQFESKRSYFLRPFLTDLFTSNSANDVTALLKCWDNTPSYTPSTSIFSPPSSLSLPSLPSPSSTDTPQSEERLYFEQVFIPCLLTQFKLPSSSSFSSSLPSQPSQFSEFSFDEPTQTNDVSKMLRTEITLIDPPSGPCFIHPHYEVSGVYRRLIHNWTHIFLSSTGHSIVSAFNSSTTDLFNAFPPSQFSQFSFLTHFCLPYVKHFFMHHTTSILRGRINSILSF